MRLDLTEIAAHLGKRIGYGIDEAPIEDLGDGLRCVDRIRGGATFANAGRTIVVRGKFATSVELACSRCLGPFEFAVELPIEEELPLVDRGLESPPETDMEELTEEEKEPLFVDNIFDLDEYLRQSVIIGLPIKPLCAEDCKGLCPHCGKNLNEGDCGCPADVGSSPFAALASLIREDEQET